MSYVVGITQGTMKINMIDPHNDFSIYWRGRHIDKNTDEKSASDKVYSIQRCGNSLA